MMIKRIQRKRTKGWRMPPNTVYVGRPSRWGNPYSVDDCGTRQVAVEFYQDWLEFQIENGLVDLAELKKKLSGKNLACWCPIGEPCHADFLMELANCEVISPSEWDFAITGERTE